MTAPRAARSYRSSTSRRFPSRPSRSCMRMSRGLTPDQYEVIGEKVTYRIAQRPGAYHVMKYRRPVIKLKASG